MPMISNIALVASHCKFGACPRSVAWVMPHGGVLRAPLAQGSGIYRGWEVYGHLIQMTIWIQWVQKPLTGVSADVLIAPQQL